MEVFHYTDRSGYNGISSAPTWLFRAAAPPTHPIGSYFTNLSEDHPLLARKLRIPREKTEWRFCFSGEARVEDDGLIRLEGGRGDYIFYSPSDYAVHRRRQLRSGDRRDGR
jgi:hypothetical protein